MEGFLLFRKGKLIVLISVVLLFSIFLGLAPATDITWTDKAGLPTARKFLSTETIDGKIYAIGGYIYSGAANYFNLNEVYDLATDSWSSSSPIPTARSSFGTAVLEGRVYAIGGENTIGDLSIVEVYDPATDSWTQATAIPTPRSGLACTAINGKIYAIGGKQNGTATNLVEVFDSNSNSWSLAAPMPTARYDLAVVNVDGKILAIGGRNGSKQAVVEEYDPVSNSWQTKAPLPNARWGLAAVELEGKVYAIGGSYPVADVDVYDQATDTWSTSTSMNNARYGLSATVANGKIYAIGGAKASTGAMACNEEGTVNTEPPVTENQCTADITSHINLEPALMLTVSPSLVEFGNVQLDSGEVTQNLTANVSSNGNWTLSVAKKSDLTGQTSGAVIPSNRFRYISPVQIDWMEFSTIGTVVDNGGPTNGKIIPITYQLIIDWTDIPDSYQAVHTYTAVQQ